jgi:hypothetical protein
MKRFGWLLILLAAGPGCIGPGFFGGDDPRKKPVVEAPPLPPPPIVADDVNEKNAAEMARKLREELERARRGSEEHEPAGAGDSQR